MKYGRYLSERKDEFKGMAGDLDEKDGVFTFVKEFPKKSPATIVEVGDDYVVLKVTPMEGRDYVIAIPLACFVLKVPY